MRDPKRIDTILKKIEEIWKEQPDLRLGQLIVNLIKVKHPGLIAGEVFYFEDDWLMECIEAFQAWLKENKK